jgi:hypothetical protein
MILSGRQRGVFEGIPRAVWEPLMRADADYLQATLEQLQAAHGSVMNYVQSELGVSAALIERIRSNLID